MRKVASEIEPQFHTRRERRDFPILNEVLRYYWGNFLCRARFRGHVILVVSLMDVLPFYAQTAPPSPNKAWSWSTTSRLQTDGAIGPPRPLADPNVSYSLPALIDIAERNNPDTRVYWERAREAGEALGLSRAALLPTLAAVASASKNQYSLFDSKFHHENTTLLPSLITLSWTVLDFGARSAKIDSAKANLLAADFIFNDTHRKLIFHVAEAYYKLLNAISQEDAAQAALTDTRTLREAVEAKLQYGFATLPDVLDARAAAAQAEYEAALIQGSVDTAQGDLATLLGMSPIGGLHVEDMPSVPSQDDIDVPVEAMIARALEQRPDLLSQNARIGAADASLRQARSAFAPVLSVSGFWGHSNGIGQQKGSPEVRSAIYPWQSQLNLTWTIFDGGARSSEIERARSAAAEARAQLAGSRDRIENEVWTAWVQLKTSRRQQQAAESLYQAAEESWSASLEAFRDGVRTFIDVSSAQKTLARARAAREAARLTLLSSIADLAFRAGDSIPGTQK